MHKGSVVILDFGGQYAHLIGRRVRECGVFSEIMPPETSANALKDAAGIIFSGGPQSVYDKGAPQGDPQIFDLGIPILGICYGLQWMIHALGGEVKQGRVKEYGKTSVKISNGACPELRRRELRISNLFRGLPRNVTVWMSHGDEAVTLPEGFECIATSKACKNAAIADEKRKIYAVQFHPEVTHTEYGMQILKNFVEMCDALTWSVESFHQQIRDQIRKEVGGKNVFMLVSGGVDSTVAFTLLNEIFGSDRVEGLLIDTGLMREGEIAQVQDAFKKVGIKNLHVLDAAQEFFSALDGVYDPEEKRKIIGKTFLNVQQKFVRHSQFSIRHSDWLLGQGTIYPDTIETGGTKHADHIKTHHNRIPEIQLMIDRGEVIEPLKDLYKDEVRTLGEELGLPHELVWRHPFPGPGLGVRILCYDKKSEIPFDKAQDRLHPKSETISKSEIQKSSVVLPIRSVGVQGDSRTYKHALVLFPNIPILEYSNIRLWQLATEIPNSYPDFNRVLLCLSHSKPIDLIVTPGSITRERAKLLRMADAIVNEEMRTAGLYEVIWQFPVVLLPVGIQKGGQSIVLRPVESTEAMTANAARLPASVLQRMTTRLMTIDSIDAVFYDLTSKPPATIEWE